MPLGKGLWDDPATVAGTIIPRGLGFDLGTPDMPFHNIYLDGAALVPTVDLQNNTYLKGYALNGTTLLDLLKADTSSNTVLNALTGKKTSLTVNNAEIANISASGLALALGKTVTLTAGSNGKAGTVTVNGATPVTVTTTAITLNSIVTFGLQAVGGTVGNTPTVKTKSAGASFTVAATALDTSTYTWAIQETV